MIGEVVMRVRSKTGGYSADLESQNQFIPHPFPLIMRKELYIASSW
jgi:hypothetical protein